MTNTEKLKEHLAKLKETKKEIEIHSKKGQTLHEEWEARSTAFTVWLNDTLDIKVKDGESVEYLIPEILLKWTEKNDLPPAA